MSFTRAFRKGLCRLLAGALVFAQLSIAAHACPALAPPPGDDAAMAAVAAPRADADRAAHGAALHRDHAAQAEGGAAGAPCEDMDTPLPTLCAEHCQQGPQVADAGQLPNVPAALPAVLYVLPPVLATDAIGHAPLPAAASAIEAVAASPPHAILHCCFRI